jgi:hypothetical protein
MMKGQYKNKKGIEDRQKWKDNVETGGKSVNYGFSADFIILIQVRHCLKLRTADS